jgi:hypothetical protein
MAFDFGPLNEACLNTFGDDSVVFQPAGSFEEDETVTAIKVDPRSLQADVPGGALMVLFLSAESGISRTPVADSDHFQVDSAVYSIVSVHADEGGGFYVALSK